MVQEQAINGLVVNKIYEDVLSAKCSGQVKDLIDSFAQSYTEKDASYSDEQWLTDEFVKHLPENSVEEVRQYASDIVNTIKNQEIFRESLQQSIREGRSSKYWLSQQLAKITEDMTEEEGAQLKQDLQTGLRDTNNKLSLTNEVNDIASEQLGAQTEENEEFVNQVTSSEDFYVNSFNKNATLNGSIYRARTVNYTEQDEIVGKEIQIVDADGNVCKTYDCFYVDDYQQVCENPESAAADFAQEHGVECQSLDFRLEAPDGTTSDILPECPNEELNEPVSDENIANRSTLAAMQGVMNKGYDMAANLSKVDDGRISDYTKKIFEEGIDAGAKMIVAGALKTASSKGLIAALPKDTSSSLIAMIAEMAVSQFSITSDLVKGKITKTQALDETTNNVFCSIVGTVASAKGIAIGAAIGTVLGPIGSTLGGLVGGSIGFLAGFNVGKLVAGHVNTLRKYAQSAIVTCAKKLHEKVVDLAHATKRTVSKLSSFISKVANKVKNSIVNFATITGEHIGNASNRIAEKVDEANSAILKTADQTVTKVINKVDEIKAKINA